MSQQQAVALALQIGLWCADRRVRLKPELTRDYGDLWRVDITFRGEQIKLYSHLDWPDRRDWIEGERNITLSAMGY
jgi:hypothetical protein